MASAKQLRIVYMGTPDFAVEPLRLLLQNGYNVVGVVTVPDKPAGRGQKIHQSAVKQFAQSNNLTVLQPAKLRDNEFVKQLEQLKPDLAIVVAFRMLPEVVWRLPRLGTFNLHASLLPDYRGAAPINWAVINGDKVTGVTTFFIDKEIDTGNVLLQKEVPIVNNETAGELHDRLMVVGAKLVLDTVNAIATAQVKAIPQHNLVGSHKMPRPAPKLFKDTTRISWMQPAEKVHNFILGLSPYPAAWCEMADSDGNTIPVKIFRTELCSTQKQAEVGHIFSDGKTYIEVGCGEGTIKVLELQLAGKRKLSTQDFLKGFREIANYSFK